MTAPRFRAASTMMVAFAVHAAAVGGGVQGSGAPETQATTQAAAENAMAASGEDDSDVLERIANGYLKNRSSFEFFRCEFQYTVGRAGDLDEAMAKGRAPRPLAAHCTWTVVTHSTPQITHFLARLGPLVGPILDANLIVAGRP
ncbi:MAG: hypothetical protein ACYTG0_46060 [Planctomycetota bacterium]|jgi:hypothetical protein